MADKIYAVIDTNVIVSAMYTRNPESPTRIASDSVLNGQVIPIFAEEIIDEYQEVLSRKEFPFKPENTASGRPYGRS